MTDALTARSWIATLWRIEGTTYDDTVRTMARMLLEIIDASDIAEVAAVYDKYGLRMIAGQS